jgi:L-lactate dehydrogenase (cytochrome)
VEWTKANTEGVEAQPDPERTVLDAIINLDDFEKAAKLTLSAKSWAFITGGSLDNITRDANREMLRRIWLRPFILRNVASVTTRTKLFGCDLEMPVYIAPTGAAKAGGAEGEVTLARAANTCGVAHCFATPSSYTHEEILEATEKQAFLQLYVNKEREKSEAAIRAAEATGKLKAIFVTVDVPVIPKREDDERVKSDTVLLVAGVKSQAGLHNDKRGAGFARQSGSFIDPTFSWEDVAWLRGITKVPLVIKGIQRASDARMAMKMGCEGIILSNHGGRAADNAPPAILILLEIQKHCPEVFLKMKVLVDGGFRRGSDIVKAICLGASAVGLGRPFLYALGYGQDGVEYAMGSKRHPAYFKSTSSPEWACTDLFACSYQRRDRDDYAALWHDRLDAGCTS